MLEKKAGVILKSTINWQLYSNNAIIIDLKNVLAFYKTGELLEYSCEDEKNIIDIKNKVYKRETKEYIMTIDFNDKVCYFILPNEEKMSVSIDGRFMIDKNKIVIEYDYGEAKRIVIEIKE